jgi:hypothetical protein
MVPVASSRNAFEAKVIAARLGSEGIVWELRGGVDGMYPVGLCEVLVEEGDVERARELLLVEDVESAFADGDESPVGRSSATERVILVVGALLLATFFAMRVLSVT